MDDLSAFEMMVSEKLVLKSVSSGLLITSFRPPTPPRKKKKKEDEEGHQGPRVTKSSPAT